MSTTVTESTERSRYEIYEGADLAGFVAYRRSGNTLDLLHTETESGFEGKGVAKRLVTETLDDARRRGLTVLPSCSYVRKVVAEHREDYLDLVPPEQRARFDLA
ncbi:GNAT family N-acetyltransferase [Rhodococcus sp. X156]|uniref:GNAT family N-acetyltransferase n=1 Tax=Rhodococcus sp. X156 TaxID=2499145 RepID=UPI000FD7DCD9|nr:GNAT family N-acetyltransferase [Rhodococcus sp. X156]